MHAIMVKASPISRLLISAGANLKHKNNEDKSPLDIAEEENSFKIADMIRQELEK
jgi:ankyrin repeat protein